MSKVKIGFRINACLLLTIVATRAPKLKKVKAERSCGSKRVLSKGFF